MSDTPRKVFYYEYIGLVCVYPNQSILFMAWIVASILYPIWDQFGSHPFKIYNDQWARWLTIGLASLKLRCQGSIDSLFVIASLASSRNKWATIDLIIESTGICDYSESSFSFPFNLPWKTMHSECSSPFRLSLSTTLLPLWFSFSNAILHPSIHAESTRDRPWIYLLMISWKIAECDWDLDPNQNQREGGGGQFDAFKLVSKSLVEHVIESIQVPMMHLPPEHRWTRKQMAL